MAMSTLAEQLQPSEISFEQLHSNYHPMLEMVRHLIGVVPNCDTLLEIWQPGFRTYNLIVPNSLNLPFSLWGMGAPKDMVGLGMYASSAAASCAYCTAHTCSFALRRGATPDAIIGNREPREAAVVAMAEALSHIPADLTKSHIDEMNRYFSPADVEWIMLGVGMMGFLNKFMDAVGVELEVESLTDVGDLLTPTDWNPGKHLRSADAMPSESHLPATDSLRTYWEVIKLAPGAINIERQWLKRVPNRWPEVGSYLRDHTGHNFPVLRKLSSKRVVRAYTAVLRDNLSTETTTIGLPVKALSGVLYGTLVGNYALAAENEFLAKHHAPSLDNKLLDQVKQLGMRSEFESADDVKQTMHQLTASNLLTQRDAACLVLARAAAPSPANLDTLLVEHAASHLSPENNIELMVWISVQQMLHRIMSFYAIASPDRQISA